MTYENITKVEQIVNPNKTSIFIKCACGTEGIDISVNLSDEEWYDEKIFYLSFWHYGNGRSSTHSIKERISRAWKVLVGKGYEANEIILNENEAYQLREFISRQLSDRDLIETLRKDKESLNLELIKIQSSSEYVSGYEHGQESVLRYTKEYFDDIIKEKPRTGHSRLSSLLDEYLNKIMKKFLSPA